MLSAMLEAMGYRSLPILIAVHHIHSLFCTLVTPLLGCVVKILYCDFEGCKISANTLLHRSSTAQRSKFLIHSTLEKTGLSKQSLVAQTELGSSQCYTNTGYAQWNVFYLHREAEV